MRIDNRIYRRHGGTVAVALAALMAGTCGSSAVTLSEAWTSAYTNNPQIMAERARLRSVDENLAIAQSGYRPTINGEIDYTLKSTSTEPPSPSDGTVLSRTYTLNATQPIYSGGQVVSAVYEADAAIRAERENLRNIEQQVMLSVVTAYMNIVRDRAILDVRSNNVRVLTEELRQVKARFDVGEVTRTDVEQARASLASSQAALEAAKASLRISAAQYLQVVGQPANGLVEPPPPDRLLPGTVDEVIANAVAARPTVVQAAFLEKSSQYTIRRLTGQLLPQFKLNGQLTSTHDPNILTDSASAATLTGQLILPIYDAGDVRAQIRQAKEQRQGRLEDIEVAREQAEADATSAWSQLQSSRAQLTANNTGVQAAQVALEGVRAELQVGQRTELDVLNAEQTLLNAREALIVTKHDLVVNGYTVLATMGRLTADYLQVAAPLYDVEAHYNDTNRKWWDIRVTREEGYAGYAPSGDLRHDLLTGP